MSNIGSTFIEFKGVGAPILSEHLVDGSERLDVDGLLGGAVNWAYLLFVERDPAFDGTRMVARMEHDLDAFDIAESASKRFPNLVIKAVHVGEDVDVRTTHIYERGVLVDETVEDVMTPATPRR